MRRNLNAALLILFFLPLVLAGCTSTSPAFRSAPEPEPAAVEPPPFHVWSFLRSYGEEPRGYSTYSYVLAGRDQSDASHAQRYNALIAAIQASTPGTSDIPDSAPRDLMNLFLIPAGWATDDWSTGLSLSLVSVLTASDARFHNPGPFIVTLYQPISFDADPEAVMLFVDLTNTHPNAMRQIATAYKRRISQAPLQGNERLRSLKSALLNALLIAEDRIGFATAAYADLKAAFVSE